MTADRRVTWLLYGMTLVAVFTLAVSSLTSFDFWWYLKSGELIVATRSVPSVDPFSFTAAGRPWINHMWATQVLFFILWKSAGRVALILLKGAVVTATFVVLLHAMRRRGVHAILACGVTLLLAWAGREFWGVRPQIVTYLFMAIFLWVLREGWDHRAAPFVWLPLIMIPWANLHAGFVTGLGIVGLVGAGAALSRLTGPASAATGRMAGWAAAWSTLRRALTLAALATLASLVNPFGIRALLFPFQIVNTQAFMAATYEWLSPNFLDPANRGFEIVLLLLVPAFAWGRAGLRATDVVLTLTFLHLALSAVRHIPLFLVAAAVPLAESLQAAAQALWVGRTDGWRGLGRLRSTLPTLWPLALAPTTHLAAAAFLVLVGLGVTWGALLDPATNPFRVDLNERRYPGRTMAFIRQERLPAPLFNAYAWGGYELWSLYPDYRMFIDGRTHVYGGDVLRDFLEVTHVGPAWEAALDRWRIQTVLAVPGSVLAQALDLSGAWRPLFVERDAVVFVRESEANRGFLSRHPAVPL